MPRPRPRPEEGSADESVTAAEMTAAEARAADARNATPVIVGIGLLVAVFGAGLLIADVRRGRERVTAASS